LKAWVSYEAGGPDTLRFGELPKPAAGPGQLLLRVAAVSLNFPDALIIEDKYQYRPPRPFAPGSEVAAVVAAVGEGVTGFSPGDRVIAITASGGLAEYAVAEAWRTFRIPDAMGFDEASTLLMVYGTNIHGLLDRGKLEPGETMLVLGAAGGIGISAVELGKALGARVVAGVSSEEKAEAARKAGADEVVIYPRPPFDRAASKALADRFKAACPGGYDLIYDPVCGDYAEPALRAIGWEGRYMVIGFTAGIASIPLNLTLLKACSIVGVFWGAWCEKNQQRFAEEMETIFRLWSEGRLRPLISERYRFEDAPAAIARMNGRAGIGKLVVTVNANP
jgi:NADPH:quinone reductase-like Zn-dependent oxidoreductase